MLSKQNRLERKDFVNLLASKRFVNTENFSLRLGAGEKVAKLAVSVSKKVSKLAVDRNTLRRRVYSVVRSSVKDLEPNSYLFVARPSAKKLKGERLEKEVFSLLNQFKKR